MLWSLRRLPGPVLAATLAVAACNAGLGDYQPESAQPTPDPFGADDDDGSPTEAGDDDSSPADDDDTGGSDDDSSPPADDDDSSPAPFEGDEPGECEDGADNDQDGYFDCDDPNCAGAPACDPIGDDDDDDDDDDATTPPGDDDDDDATTPPPAGAPNITNVLYTWNAASSEFRFDIYVFDSDCNIGSPTVYWWLDGIWQGPQAIGGSATCNATIWFWVGGMTAGQTYSFQFQVMDSVGMTSNVWTIAATAS